MEVCRAYVEAQREYAALKIGGQTQFAPRFMSAPGQHDGLYWPVKPGDPESPLGPLIAQAQASGYTAGEGAPAGTEPRPFHGYYFRILTAQGSHAPSGAKELSRGQPHDGRICADRLSGHVREFRRHDVYRQSERDHL